MPSFTQRVDHLFPVSISRYLFQLHIGTVYLCVWIPVFLPLLYLGICIQLAHNIFRSVCPVIDIIPYTGSPSIDHCLAGIICRKLPAANAEPSFILKPLFILHIIRKSVIGLSVWMRHLDKAVFTTAHFHHIVCGFKMVIRPAVRKDLCKFLIIIAPSGIKERFGRKDHKMIRDQLL